MRYSAFYGPILKALNAEHHLRQLRGLYQRVSDSEHYYLALEDDAIDETKQILRIKERGPFPANIALTLGDAIHNLRSSLDLLACDLVALNGNSVKNVYFPIANTRDVIDTAISVRPLSC